MELFLGFEDLECDSALYSAFNLRSVTYQGKSYLGKSVGPLANFSDLELSEEHLQSLLKRLLPGSSYPLYLIAYEP